jgi:integrase
LLRVARHQPHLARFILLGIYTGTRSGALLAAQWSWVDLVGGKMHRRTPGMAENVQKRTPPVRLGRRVLAHLRRWKRIDGGINGYVIHYDGKRIQKMRRSWRTAVKAAGLGADVTPHVMRHSRATWMMQARVPVWEAAGALGMSLETLERTYGHHHPDFQKKAAEV